MVAGAVRHDGHVPLGFRPADAWTGHYHGGDGDSLRTDGQGGVEVGGQILDAAVRHQFRVRYRNRPRARISVRNQLVQLQLVRGGYLRGASRHRGHTRLLHGGYFHLAHVFRMEEAEPGGSPCFHVAHGSRSHHFGVMDTGGQRLDAVSGRDGVQSRYRPQRNARLLVDTAFARRC